MGEAWPRDRWQAAIWTDGMLKPNEKLVAHAFAFRAFEKETVYATYEDLGRLTGLARSSIAVARKGLEAAGWLAQVKGAFYHQAPVFRLTYPLGRLLEGVSESHPDRMTPRQDDGVSDGWGPGDGPHGVRETDGWGPGDGPINSPSNSPLETHASASSKLTDSAPRRRGATTKDDFAGAVEFIADYAGYTHADAVEFCTLLREERPKLRSLLAFLRSMENAGTLDGFLGNFYVASGAES